MSSTDKTSSAADSRQGKKETAIYLAIFLVALAARLSYVLPEGQSSIFSAMDASEYMRSAQTLQSLTANLLNTNEKIGVQALASVSEVFSRSGPVYPIFLLVCSILWNFLNGSPGDTIFATSTTKGVVILQCLVTAIAPVLIAFSAHKISGWRGAVPAGLIAAVYPGMIIGSARLISESLATVLVSAILALAAALIASEKTARSGIYAKCIALGLTLGILQLTRSALALATIASLLIAVPLLKNSRGRKIFLTLLGGILCAIAPYMIVKGIVSGDSSALVDRLSSYNLLVGVDLDARGWLAYPFSNFTAAYESSHPEIIKRAMEHSPYRFVELMICKLPRLFAFPWNDFKSPIGTFSPGQLVFFHQVVLSLAGAGLCLTFGSQQKEDKNSRGFLIRLVVIALFLIHLAYILFESQPRYALTAVPTIIIMAGYALARIASSSRPVRITALVITLIFLQLSIDFRLFQTIPALSHPYAALAFAAVTKIGLWTGLSMILYSISKELSLPAGATKITIAFVTVLSSFYTVTPLPCFQNPGEWYHGADPGKKSRINQTINLKALQNSAEDEEGKRNFYLIFDASNWRLLGQNASILVGGKRLPDETPSLPLMSLVEELNKAEMNSENQLVYTPEEVLSAMLNSAGGNNQELRQWFLVPIPKESVAGQELEVTLEKNWTEGAEERLYGTHIFKRNQVTIPGPGRYSWDKAFYGVENLNGFSDMRYQTSIKIEGLTDSKEDLSPSPGMQNGSYNLRLLAVKDSTNSRQESFITRTTGSIESELPLDKTRPFARASLKPPDDENEESLYFATVSLSAHSEAKDPVPVPISVAATTTYRNTDTSEIRTEEVDLNSAWTPSYMVLNQGNNRIKFSFPVKTRVGTYRATSVEVRLYRGGRADGVQHFSVYRLPNTSPDHLLEMTRASVRLQEFNLSLTKAGLRTPLSAYEIF